VERARRGEGVTLLEVRTFRMKGHAEHDNQSYVPPALIDEWRARDPIERFERLLLELGAATPSDFSAIDARIRAELDVAVEEADASPMPRGEEAARGLFAGDGYWEKA
jgi:TPP-dependent pyruvate/acetoin dehydrogenase alpha subunit